MGRAFGMGFWSKGGEMQQDTRETVRYAVPGLTISSQHVRGKGVTLPTDAVIDVDVKANWKRDWPGTALVMWSIIFFFGGLVVGAGLEAFGVSEAVLTMLFHLLVIVCAACFSCGVAGIVLYLLLRKRFVVVVRTTFGETPVYWANDKQQAETAAKAIRQARPKATEL